MRKILGTFLVVMLTFSFVGAPKAHAEMSARTRAFLTIVGYGTAGGAIVGAASMAFGNSTRAVAQGASLGLYGGIIFASYILISHHNRRTGSYDDNSSPYQESNDIYGDEYNPEDGGADGSQSGSFFNRYETMNMKFGAKNKGGQLPPIKINLLKINF
jgi:hypothetical protein